MFLLNAKIEPNSIVHEKNQQLTWSFRAILDLIAVSDGEVEERRSSKSRGCLLEKGVGSGAVCKSFVPHSKLAQVANEPLTRLNKYCPGAHIVAHDL